MDYRTLVHGSTVPGKGKGKGQQGGVSRRALLLSGLAKSGVFVACRLMEETCSLD